MSKLYNNKISDRARETFGFKQDTPEAMVLDILTPVVEIKPKADYNNYGSATNGFITFPPNDTEKFFYLTGYCLSYEISSLSDAPFVAWGYNNAGGAQFIVYIPVTTGIAKNGVVAGYLDYPMKIPKGATMYGDSSATVGTAKIGLSIMGYYEGN